MIPPIVDAAFVDAHPDAVLCDVRWYLDGRDGHAAFVERHLPGAIWVDLERDLAGHDLPTSAGRHPLPSAEAFATAMSALGIGDDTTVIAYDDTGGMTAGRLVVMLRLLGHDAALLNGGLRGWSGRTESASGRPVVPAQFSPRPWPTERFADADDTAVLARDAKAAVLDARAHERFTGEVAMVDPRPGHVPGARNAPWAAVLDEDGFVRDPADLRAYFGRLGVDDDSEVVGYCGSGVSTCLNLLALEHAGLPAARLYVASWSGWAADPARPAAVGE